MGGGGLVDAGFISLVGAAAGPSGGGWVLPSLSDILMCAVFACLIWLGTAQFSRWFDVPSPDGQLLYLSLDAGQRPS